MGFFFPFKGLCSWAAWFCLCFLACVPLWVLWATWFYICFPFISHSGLSGPHDFTLVSHLSPILISDSGCSRPHAFTLVYHLSPTLGDLGRMILYLSPTCLPHLSPTLVSHTCFPHLFPTLVSHIFLPLWVLWAAWFCMYLPPVSHVEYSGPQDFTLVSHLFSRLTQNILLLDLYQLPYLAAVLDSFTFIWGQRWDNLLLIIIFFIKFDIFFF